MVCLEQMFCVIIKQNLASFSKLKKKNLFLLRNLEFCVFKFMKVSVVLLPSPLQRLEKYFEFFRNIFYAASVVKWHFT